MSDNKRQRLGESQGGHIRRACVLDKFVHSGLSAEDVEKWAYAQEQIRGTDPFVQDPKIGDALLSVRLLARVTHCAVLFSLYFNLRRLIGLGTQKCRRS